MAKEEKQSSHQHPGYVSESKGHEPGYFEKRVNALKDLLLEKGLLGKDESAQIAKGGELGHDHSHDDVFERFHTDNPVTMEEHEMTPFEKQVIALGNLLREKQIISTDEVRRKVEENEAISPHQGSRVVARAWVDPDYKKRLFANAKAAAEELGIDMSTANQLIALENTDKAHHVVVCTLCSCYPRQLLGQPPEWYKSTTYRSRVVVDPRRVLKEMGLELPEATEIRVVDSTAETRYLVVPLRPEGTEGWSQEDLVELVTRNSMIGVAQALTPGQTGNVPAEEKTSKMP
ncbi:MAG: nitrile hydratase subunit alpha [Candidatus Binatia bacterium]